MTRFAWIFASLLAAMLLSGCDDTSSVKRETKVSTPEGSTTTTTEQTIEKSGDRPPPATP